MPGSRPFGVCSRAARFEWKNPASHNYIDGQVFTKLRLRANPSELCSDEVFLWRAHLTLGILPNAEEARAFVRYERADKRSRLIDELLRRSEFADAC